MPGCSSTPWHPCGRVRQAPGPKNDRAACCEDLSEAELAVFLAGLDASSIEEGCNAHQYY